MRQYYINASGERVYLPNYISGEGGSLSASDATANQVPTADGNGGWSWATPDTGSTYTAGTGIAISSSGVISCTFSDADTEAF